MSRRIGIRSELSGLVGLTDDYVGPASLQKGPASSSTRLGLGSPVHAASTSATAANARPVGRTRTPPPPDSRSAKYPWNRPGYVPPSGLPTYIIPGVSLSILARGIGMSLAGISRIMDGTRSPKLANLRKIAAFLGLTETQVLAIIDERKKDRKHAHVETKWVRE